jgi:predicted DNA-binding transcriptional regulator AlpA
MYFKQPIVRPAELAAALSVSTVTLWNWRRNGILPEPITFGPRFIGWPNDVLNEWLSSHKRGDS